MYYVRNYEPSFITRNLRRLAYLTLIVANSLIIYIFWRMTWGGGF